MNECFRFYFLQLSTYFLMISRQFIINGRTNNDAKIKLTKNINIPLLLLLSNETIELKDII
jgi:hypothetical protein